MLFDLSDLLMIRVFDSLKNPRTTFGVLFRILSTVVTFCIKKKFDVIQT